MTALRNNYTLLKRRQELEQCSLAPQLCPTAMSGEREGKEAREQLSLSPRRLIVHTPSLPSLHLGGFFYQAAARELRLTSAFSIWTKVKGRRRKRAGLPLIKPEEESGVRGTCAGETLESPAHRRPATGLRI